MIVSSWRVIEGIGKGTQSRPCAAQVDSLVAENAPAPPRPLPGLSPAMRNVPCVWRERKDAHLANASKRKVNLAGVFDVLETQQHHARRQIASGMRRRRTDRNDQDLGGGDSTAGGMQAGTPSPSGDPGTGDLIGVPQVKGGGRGAV